MSAVKFMSFVKMLMLAALIVAMIVNVILFTLSYTLLNTVFEPNFIDNFLQRNRIYDKLRNWALIRLSSELPHGREGLLYFEKAISSEWLRQKSKLVFTELILFLSGESENLPILRLSIFKEKVLKQMKDSGNLKETREFLEYWLSPLPDAVRFNDLFSTQMLYNLREFTMSILNVKYGSLLFLIAASTFVFIITRKIEETILWFCVAICSAGFLTVLYATLALLIPLSINQLNNIQTSMVGIGFPDVITQNLTNKLQTEISIRIRDLSILLTVIGSFVLYITPEPK